MEPLLGQRLNLDENSQPGTYLGAAQWSEDQKWYAYLTLVSPRSLNKPVLHGKVADSPGFDTQIEAMAFVQEQVLPRVEQMMGNLRTHTEFLVPVGAA